MNEVEKSGATPSSTERILAEIAKERQRQIEKEGWTAEHDDEHEAGALASAAAAYGHRAQFELRPKNDGKQLPELDVDPIVTALWPFDEEWWKPKGARRDLVRAAALIVAELERIDRQNDRDVAFAERMSERST